MISISFKHKIQVIFQTFRENFLTFKFKILGIFRFFHLGFKTKDIRLKSEMFLIITSLIEELLRRTNMF